MTAFESRISQTEITLAFKCNLRRFIKGHGVAGGAKPPSDERLTAAMFTVGQIVVQCNTLPPADCQTFIQALVAPGRVVQLELIKPVLKAPITKRSNCVFTDCFQVLISMSTCAATAWNRWYWRWLWRRRPRRGPGTRLVGRCRFTLLVRNPS